MFNTCVHSSLAEYYLHYSSAQSDALVPNNACRAQGVFPVLASCYTQDLSSMSEHVADGLLKGSSRDVR